MFAPYLGKSLLVLKAQVEVIHGYAGRSQALMFEHCL